MKEPAPFISGLTGAVFSQDKKHRLGLWRLWDISKPMVLFIGLNPSRGNEFFNDPTITRCIAFAKAWNCGGIMFGNLFTLKSPKPAPIKQDPEGACHPINNEWLLYMNNRATHTVLCWGSWDFTKMRSTVVIDLVRTTTQPKCFGLNADGSPKHPLYLKGTSQLIDFPTKCLITKP